MGEWQIQGKTFLITGGASGLGALYAEAFLKEGAKKVALVDIAEDVGKATTARLNAKYHGKVFFAKCDVSKEEDITVAFDKVVAEFGYLDVLVNNAGIMVDSPSVWRKACDVNWLGLVSFTLKAVKHMRKDEGGKGGTILNIASIAGVMKLKALPIYAGSKAAVVHFTLSLADGSFFEETGVRLAAVVLGPTDTTLLHGLKGRSYDEKVGAQFEKEHDAIKGQFPPQKPDSAVAALIKIYKDGKPGSVWLPAYDKPVKDVTSIMNNLYEQFMQIA